MKQSFLELQESYKKVTDGLKACVTLYQVYWCEGANDKVQMNKKPGITTQFLMPSTQFLSFSILAITEFRL